MTFDDDIETLPKSATDVTNERRLLARIVLAIAVVCAFVMLASSR